MKVSKVDLETQISDYSYIALGNFDGVHLGHRQLIDTLTRESYKNGLLSSVLIFTEHTKNTIEGGKQKLLTSNKVKYEILKQLGVDIIYEMKFNEQIMKLSPESFIVDFLLDHLKVKGIIVGYDYRFGYRAEGNIELLKKIAGEKGIDLYIIDAVYRDGQIISSTRIRKLIEEGKIQQANLLLVRPFTIEGEVVKGKGLARKLGIPTANLKMDLAFTTPRFGVYSGRVRVGDRSYDAAINVGINPTFDEAEVKLEAYLLDFSGNLYGQKVQVSLDQYLRPEIKFDSVDALKNQMLSDVDKIRSKKSNNLQL